VSAYLSFACCKFLTGESLSWATVAITTHQPIISVLPGIGCGVIVLGYCQVMFMMIASERQTHRIRTHFYRNILRQDIGWFDTHESAELNSRLTG